MPGPDKTTQQLRKATVIEAWHQRHSKAASSASNAWELELVKLKQQVPRVVKNTSELFSGGGLWSGERPSLDFQGVKVDSS